MLTKAPIFDTLTTMNETGDRHIITCQQVLTGNGSVFSSQRTVFPARCAETLTPQLILDEYLLYLRRFTLSLARAAWTDNGLEFRFFFTKLHILTFAPPQYVETSRSRSVTLRICGGHFVQCDQCNRGRFSFFSEIDNEGVRVSVELSDYFPRLLGSGSPSLFRKLLYRLTQAALHKLMTTRFLAHLYRKLTGESPPFQIIKACERSGEEI